MTILTQEQLARRIAAGSGCLDKGCTVEFVTDQRAIEQLNHPFKQVAPGDGILVHKCEVQGDPHDIKSLVLGETVVQLLDEDDMQGLDKRLHMMEHFRADHDGKSPECGTIGHGDPPPQIETLFITGSMPVNEIPAEILLEAVKALAEINPGLRALLQREYGSQS